MGKDSTLFVYKARLTEVAGLCGLQGLHDSGDTARPSAVEESVAGRSRDSGDTTRLCPENTCTFKKKRQSFADDCTGSPGLAFIAYPRAVAMMPLPQLWACCFFLMVILLGLDSQFVGLESLTTAISDMRPAFFQRGSRRELLLLFICVSCFFVGLLMVTEGGLYLFQLFDYYACSGICLLFLSIVHNDISLHQGTFIFSLVKYTLLKYNRTYEYPAWGYILGWFLALSSMVLVPLWIVFKLTRTKGTIHERLRLLCLPASDLPLGIKQKSCSCPCNSELLTACSKQHGKNGLKDFSTEMGVLQDCEGGRGGQKDALL
ncbi:S6A13 protein, partial [Polyodon spathula]|nr:S6A13 protein [Polyodon spathula]